MAVGHEILSVLGQQYTKIVPALSKKIKRLWAGATALELGYGGVTAVSQLTGLAPNTMYPGVLDAQDPEVVASPCIRQPGAGGKRIEAEDQSLEVRTCAIYFCADPNWCECPLYSWHLSALTHVLLLMVDVVTM